MSCISPVHLAYFERKKRQIGTTFKRKCRPCGVYYPIPLHLQKAYQDKRYNEADFEVTNQLVKEVISLPMHTELDDEQIDFIAKLVIDFVNR